MSESGADSFSDYSPAIGLEEREARAAFVLGLRGRGVRSLAVLTAIERVPRRLFLAAIYHKLAYRDAAVPIECGQTAAAPSHVARMVEALQVEPTHRVLEVGTGSGYQTAVLSHLAGEVVSIERFRTLIGLTRQRLAALKLNNLKVCQGDGLNPVAEEEPESATDDGGDAAPLRLSVVAPLGPKDRFDRIIVNGAWHEVPKPLLRLLRPGGQLLIPLGGAGESQAIVRVTAPANPSGAEPPEQEVLDRMRTTALIRGVAEHL